MPTYSRNRKSKKSGSSWTARSRRLREAIEHDGVDETGASSGGHTQPNLATPPSQRSPQLPPVPLPFRENVIGDVVHGERSGEDRFDSTDVHTPYDRLDDDHSSHPPSRAHQQQIDDELTAAEQDVFRTLRDRMHIVTQLCLVGLMTLYGACCYKTRQYDHLCSILIFAQVSFTLPSSSSLRKVKWPFFIDHLFPKGKVVEFTMHHSEENEECGSERIDVTDGATSGVRPKKAKVAVIPVSEWAKYDISNTVFLSDLLSSQKLYESYKNGGDIPERVIERSRLVQHSEDVSTEADSLFLRSAGDTLVRCRRADIMSFSCIRDIMSFSCIRDGTSTINPAFRFNATCDAPAGIQQGAGRACFTFTPGAFDAEPHDPNSAFSDFVSQPLSSLSGNEICVLRYLKSRVSSRRHDAHQHDGFRSTSLMLYPGDICTVFLPVGSTTDVITEFGVLINRFWRTEQCPLSLIVTLLQCDLTDPANAIVQTSYTAQLKDTPQLIQTDNGNGVHNPGQDIPVSGTLHDGTKYYVYRILLYCDDFVPRSNNFPKGSVGGCYFIPLSLGTRRRRGASAIRTIAVTPTGISTNAVLDYMIDDLIKGATDGFASVDAEGNEVRIFLEVIGFIGDYPESAKVLDVLRHSARAPCTTCTFRHRTAVSSSMYAYSVIIHSFNSSFSRSLRRSLSIRSADLTTDDCKFLGYNAGTLHDIQDFGRWPLLKLACAYDRVKTMIPLSDKQVPVITASFDPYSRNAVAPDHLLACFGKYLIELIVKSLLSDSSRSKLEILLATDLRTLGFGTHSSLFNKEKKTLNSISMSTSYAILMIIIPHLRTMEHSIDSDILHFAHLFTKLIGLTFWWPSLSLDGGDAFDLVHGDNQQRYHAQLQSLATSFVHAVGRKCETSPLVKQYLDRPNIHRILEIYYHTIPRFSHASFCSDMSFEHNHQPLKSSLLRNSNLNCHVSAVYHSLGIDWFRRVCELLAFRSSLARNSSSSTSEQTIRRSLKRLFFGEVAITLSQTSPESRNIGEVIDKHIDEILDEPFKNLLFKWYSSHVCGWVDGCWIGTSLPQRQRASSRGTRASVQLHGTCSPALVDRLAVNLEQYLQEYGLQSNTILFDKISYTQTLGDLKKRLYPNNILRCGDSVQCFLHAEQQHETVLEPCQNGDRERFFF